MKLLRATFHNFRLLRDLSLDFSSHTDRRLTVIRAANESGKTTILHALQWALYGDDALPGRGQGFRLRPLDLDLGEEEFVKVAVAVDYEVSTYRRISGKLRETRRMYRLVRAALEDIDDRKPRGASTVKLFALDERGDRLIEPPESTINEQLPPELREVFFTDGDRALSFIEADAAISTKRERVQRAIRSLLGLGVIEDSIKHVRKSEAEANKRAKRIGAGGALKEVTSRLERLEEVREELETNLEDSKLQFAAFDEKFNEIDRKISEALSKGDKEKLENSLSQARARVSRLNQQHKEASKEHSALFRSQVIATELLSPLMSKAFQHLEDLHTQGKIPSATIPVLEDRLSADVCICGETLAPDDASGKRRRAHIRTLIEDNRRSNEIQKILTDLYYDAKPMRLIQSNSDRAWAKIFQEIVKRRDEVEEMREEAGRSLRSLEQQIDALPDTDIKRLRELRRNYNYQRDRQLEKKSTFKTQLEVMEKERVKLEKERVRLLKEQEKGTQILAELDVAQDVRGVLQSAYGKITTEELQRVSDLMNRIFLEMIGADPEQGAVIRKAEISSEFDILVYGPENRALNPDRDLNGASRRALTLAFILALTKVSEVEAPNVIDTPLGMTSGYVKRSILQNSVRESSQLILFLTHDEVSGCEEIIDREAGAVFTLTNTAHYPKMLVNDPKIKERKVFRCMCDHRTECSLCQRYVEAQVHVGMTT